MLRQNEKCFMSKKYFFFFTIGVPRVDFPSFWSLRRTYNLAEKGTHFGFFCFFAGLFFFVDKFDLLPTRKNFACYDSLSDRSPHASVMQSSLHREYVAPCNELLCVGLLFTCRPLRRRQARFQYQINAPPPPLPPSPSYTSPLMLMMEPVPFRPPPSLPNSICQIVQCQYPSVPLKMEVSIISCKKLQEVFLKQYTQHTSFHTWQALGGCQNIKNFTCCSAKAFKRVA